MNQTVDLVLAPADAADPESVRTAAEAVAGWAAGDARHVRVVKRSVDARARQVRVLLRVELSSRDPFPPLASPPPLLDVRQRPVVLIVGAGPAGLFAALRIIELGLRPLVLERGKDVRARRHDLAALTQRHVVNPDSNYCFGEGGAGTYSDGKLYTRSAKRGDVQAILRAFVAYGASPDILVDAHPHIGTNKLPGIIAAMRQAINAAGGGGSF